MLLRVVLLIAQKLPQMVLNIHAVLLTIATVQTPSPRTKFWSLPSWLSSDSLSMQDFKRIYTTSKNNNFFHRITILIINFTKITLHLIE
jgi:hypothetical protein